MKKIMLSILLSIFIAGTANAVAVPSDEDYKNLDDLRVKLVRMRREMDKFIKDIMATYPNQTAETAGIFGQDVRVDVVQTDNDIMVKADLPGMDKDKIEIALENNKMLKIAGSRESVKSQATPGLITQERMTGRFERVLELPAECMSEGIRATYKNGVLEVVIPKKKITKEEVVKINVQ